MEVKKYPKANLDRGSLIFFQIGLILALTATYYGMEWRSYAGDDKVILQIEVPELDEENIPVTRLNTPPPPPPPPPPPMPQVIEVVQDEKDVEETTIQSTESSQDDRIEDIALVEDILYEEEEEEIEQVPFMVVENIPVFPGCEDIQGKEAQKKCISEKIDAHVKRHFNTRISEEMGLNGLNRIYVVFKINEHGEVADIRSRAPNKRLEQEAARVVNLLPKMIPGRQRDRPVSVEYSLPIVYEIREQL